MVVPPRVRITNPRTKRQWEKLLKDWDNCDRCPLSKDRNKVVHAQGRFPCTVLFIGEAPGFDENASGFPFVGRSGRLLTEHFIPAVQQSLGVKFHFAIINVVGCLPTALEEAEAPDLPPRSVIRQPHHTEVSACRPHLDNLIHMSLPKACVLLGKVPGLYVGTHITGHDLKPIQTHTVYHPAYILRQGGHGSLSFDLWVKSAMPYLEHRLR